MENNQINIESQEPQENPLFKVTKLSKYLSVGLMIVLPFLGFWLGLNQTTKNNLAIELENQYNSEPIVAETTDKSSAPLYTSEQNCESKSKTVPQYNNTFYKIIYTKADTSSYKEEEVYPYSPECKASLALITDGTIQIIIDDLRELMLQQNLSTKDGLPQPYIFYNNTNSSKPVEKFIFGGNNYEGSFSPLFVLDTKNKTFKKLTETIPSPVKISDDYNSSKKIIIPQEDNIIRVLDIDSENLFEITLPNIESSETIMSECGMGCVASIGWIDGTNLWYTVYAKEESSAKNKFLRIEHLEFKPNQSDIINL